MRERLLSYIWCPDCQADLHLSVDQKKGAEIISGRLSCPRCRLDYPIIKAIPRFINGINSEADLRKVYADSFGHQWTTYDWLRDEDEFEFFQITDLSREDLEGKTVLDVGCGGGRVARFVSAYSGEFFGLDYSIAVEKAYELTKGRENAHFVQCDVNKHPFKPSTFDIVYSHGVLHHTPNTKKSFDNLPPLIKDGGTLYIAVFQKAFWPLQISDGLLRSVLNKLPIETMDKVCDAMTYLRYLPSAAFVKRFFWFSLQRTKEIRKCCLYDWYAPQYHHEHDVEEVQRWFTKAGFPNSKYINAWPYCPNKYKVPDFADSMRIGRLLGVIGKKTAASAKTKNAKSREGMADGCRR
jgi:SAM-dependent methyltransferase